MIKKILMELLVWLNQRDHTGESWSHCSSHFFHLIMNKKLNVIIFKGVGHSGMDMVIQPGEEILIRNRPWQNKT